MQVPGEEGPDGEEDASRDGWAGVQQPGGLLLLTSPPGGGGRGGGALGQYLPIGSPDSCTTEFLHYFSYTVIVLILPSCYLETLNFLFLIFPCA